MKIPGYLITAVLLIALAAGCKKNQAIDLRPDINVANDQVLATRPFVYAFRMLVRAVSDPALQSVHYSVIDSAIVTLDMYKKIYVFAFHGLMGADSVSRTGSFIITLDSGFYLNGTRIAVAFQSYAEDGHLVTGGDSIRCNGFLDGKYRYGNVIRMGLITKDSARMIQFGAEYQVAVAVDAMAQGVVQTVISFDGTTGGISSGGYSYSSAVTSSLTVYGSCPWIKDGIIALSVPAAEVQTGTVEFMSKTMCNDEVWFDFGGTVSHTRMMDKYLTN